MLNFPLQPRAGGTRFLLGFAWESLSAGTYLFTLSCSGCLDWLCRLGCASCAAAVFPVFSSRVFINWSSGISRCSLRERGKCFLAFLTSSLILHVCVRVCVRWHAARSRNTHISCPAERRNVASVQCAVNCFMAASSSLLWAAWESVRFYLSPTQLYPALSLCLAVSLSLSPASLLQFKFIFIFKVFYLLLSRLRSSYGQVKRAD